MDIKDGWLEVHLRVLSLMGTSNSLTILATEIGGLYSE
jgi:hypothetical protein